MARSPWLIERSLTADSVGFIVDMEPVIARMKAMGAEMDDLKGVYRDAMKPMFGAYKAAVPGSGHMTSMVYKQATVKYGAVGLRHTGWGNTSNDYVGVVEFGGTIPVPHSRPRGTPRRRASADKPWIGGLGGTSYYLYPLWEKMWPTVVPPFVRRLRVLCNRYFPGKY